MALTAKHKEAIQRGEKRSKELNDFLNEKGDNMTLEDLKQARGIKEDIVKIQDEIKVHVEADELRADAQGFSDFHTKPTAAMRHQAVVGSQLAGGTVLQRERKGSKALRVLRQNGAGLFGKETFDGISTGEYRKAFKEYLRHGDKLRGAHFRNLEVGLDPQGGALAPVEMIAKLIERKPTPARLQDLVSVVNCSRDAIALPRVNYAGASDDTSAYIYSTGFRATATDENPTSDTQALVSDSNLFGSIRVPNYTWLIEGVLTNNQVEDAMFDPMAWLQGKFLETVMLLREQMIASGSGIGQSTGIVTSALAGTDLNQNVPVVVTGSAAAITADGLISCSEDVPEQYDENCRWVFNKTATGKAIRLLKDSQNRYLFANGTQDSGLVPGRQRTLNGYPVVYSQFIASPGANNVAALFGDFEGYTQVNRVGFSVQVLREVAARRNQIIVLGRVRFGGLPLEPWRLRAHKCSA